MKVHMRSLLISALALTALALPCQSNAQVQLCAQINEAISDSLGEIGRTLFDGITDDSAPRATLRHLRIENEIGFINLNLQLLSSAKCATWKLPFRGYMKSVRECNAALEGKASGNGTEEALSAACKPLLDAGKTGSK
jgi:hypothetical protein